jgi:hypothetical protein
MAVEKIGTVYSHVALVIAPTPQRGRSAPDAERQREVQLNDASRVAQSQSVKCGG